MLHHCVPAQRYAGVFKLRATDQPPPGSRYRLYYDEQGMALLSGGGAPAFRLQLAPIQRRARQAMLLARACGAGQRPSVADLMAGWGSDGLCLALKGCTVTLVERSLLVWAMLDEFVQRHQLPAKVVLAEAGAWCRAHPGSVDVAYLDPMFPPSRKTALPEQSMQHLRRLAAGDGQTLSDRIASAGFAARARVVVKRRRSAPACPKPGWQHQGRRIRFDVYPAPRLLPASA